MNVAAIVPAAGKGRRIRLKTEKPYIKLCGKPILIHTLTRLLKNRHIKEIIVAVNRDRLSEARDLINNRYGLKDVKIVAGGRERKDSVFRALRNISQGIDYILVHDSVRPFVTNRLIDSSLKAARRFKASVVAVPVKFTLKYIRKNGCIHYTPDRRYFWEAQTPQVFRRDLIEKAYREENKSGICLTDDSMLVENLGVSPKLVLGSYSNIKITTVEDLELAKIFCRKRPSV